jgi:CRP-like cAMP-binding protein
MDATVCNRSKFMRPSLDMLKALPMLEALPADSLAVLAEQSAIESRPKGTVIQEQDDHPAYFYYLIEGTIECSSVVFDVERCLKFIHAGEFFPLNAVVLNDLTVSSYAALSECVVLRLPARLIREFLVSTPQFAFAALQESANYCRDLICEKKGAHIRNGADRLAAWLIAEAHRRNATSGIEITLPKGKIADLLGFAPEMLSRYLTMLKDFGVSSTHNTIKVDSLERLENFLETQGLSEKWLPANADRPMPFGKLRAAR